MNAEMINYNNQVLEAKKRALEVISKRKQTVHIPRNISPFKTVAYLFVILFLLRLLSLAF